MSRVHRPDRPIYLHFLDRELGQAAEFTLTPRILQRSLNCLVAATSSPLYCGISLIWENTALSGECRRLLARLSETQVLWPVSYSSSVDDFIESRQRLYRHDAGRYPFYFSAKVEDVRTIKPSSFKTSDTTSELQGYLGSWASTAGRTISAADRTARRSTLTALGLRDTEALTSSFFDPFLNSANAGPASMAALRQAISLGYTSHYLDYCSGDIATGVPGLAFFDSSLARWFPAHDIIVLASLLRIAGLADFLDDGITLDHPCSRDLLAIRGFGAHWRITQYFKVAISAAYTFAADSCTDATQFGLRSAVLSFLAKHGYPTEQTATYAAQRKLLDRLELAEQQIHAALSRMARDPRLRAVIEVGKMELLQEHADILLVTATATETRAVIETLKASANSQVRRAFLGDKTYWDLGFIAAAHIYLVQTEMGSVGPSGSVLTVNDGIEALRPTSIIMVGVAFGVDEQKQRLGEILVSRQVLTYELQRLGRSNVAIRGDRVPASARLLDRCRAAAITWHGPEPHFGLVISGEKLVDNIDFRHQLAELAGGEVIGGEMEGAGLYSSAHRRKIDWILIKAICDWADGNKAIGKSQRQRRAALNAASFVRHVLEQGGLVG